MCPRLPPGYSRRRRRKHAVRIAEQDRHLARHAQGAPRLAQPQTGAVATDRTEESNHLAHDLNMQSPPCRAGFANSRRALRLASGERCTLQASAKPPYLQGKLPFSLSGEACPSRSTPQEDHDAEEMRPWGTAGQLCRSPNRL